MNTLINWLVDIYNNVLDVMIFVLSMIVGACLFFGSTIIIILEELKFNNKIKGN